MKTKHILIVDDSQFFIRLLKELLKRSDYDVIAASDGHEALRIIESKAPDLILMDLNMEGMDGDTCCCRIKSNPVTAGIPVIMLTTSNDDYARGKCKDAGCDDYLTKPVDRVLLLRKIKQYIDIPVREYERAPICAPCVYYSVGSQFSGTIYAISEKGLFIKGEAILDRGSRIKVVFDIADLSTGIEALGEVVWNTDEKEHFLPGLAPGIGVRFKSIGEDDMEIIRRYINLGKYLV